MNTGGRSGTKRVVRVVRNVADRLARRGQRLPAFWKAGAAHPGWLLIAPGNRPYAWYSYDRARSYDEISAMSRFEPSDILRDRMIRDGWMVCAGSGVELIGGGHAFTKVSA
ncbi:hypothetical protein [Mycobacterium avium]|uniref:hypothetical protein n=1 Tax=Mycobacterium avium TaxID=1764 RepID=UPI00111BE22E|nr:hypothetical protein [Mycobacterium avium]